MQIKSIVAWALKNDGFLLAYRDRRVGEAVDTLLKSIRLIAEVVKIRDERVKEQATSIIKANLEDIIVISEGSNHSYFAAELERSMGAEVHRQPDDAFSYYDEALIGYLEGRIDEAGLRRLLHRELEFNYGLIASYRLLASLGDMPEIYIEDITRDLRAALEERTIIGS